MATRTFRDDNEVLDRIQSVTGEKFSEIFVNSLGAYFDKISNPLLAMYEINDLVNKKITVLESQKLDKRGNQVLDCMYKVQEFISKAGVIK